MWPGLFRRFFVRFRRHVRVHFRTYIYAAFLLVFGALITHIYLDLNKLVAWERSGSVTTTTLPSPVVLSPEQQRQVLANREANKEEAVPSRAELRQQWLKEKIEQSSKKISKNSKLLEVPASIPINYNVHIFYYGWYETPEVDGKWQHWNHEYIPSWKPNDKKDYPVGRHNPPADIGANFYPQLGCYSSRDPLIIDAHMKMIRDAGIGVLVVSWYPPGLSDGKEIKPPDSLFPILLDAAAKFDLKVAPHVEPYENRNPINFLQHLKQFHAEYGKHPALLKMMKGDRLLPVIYVYDSYRTHAAAWRELLAVNGNISLRGSANDAIFLGLLVDMQHKNEIKRAHFDGFYTYFASNGFSYGSTWKNWKTLSRFADDANMLFVPSIGPGYIDTRVRPWNAGNTRHRRKGSYYDVAWRTAISAKAPIISITSFNEWHEGTQIEPAIPYSTASFQYLDYEPDGPMFYMISSRWWVREYSKFLNSTL